jgi:hypothetical protein
MSSLTPSATSTPCLGHNQRGPTTTPLSPRMQSLPSSPRARSEHTTPPPPPIRCERTTPPSSPQAQLEPIIPPSSAQVGGMRATSSRHITPSSAQLNRESLPPPHNRVRLPPAPFRQGYTPGPKPKAADYDDSVEKMLLNAMHEYSCLILSTDAFPDDAKQTQWAEATWRAACEEVGAYYECSLRMIRLVSLQYCCLFARVER